jgi:hypothetical protein
MTDPSLLRIQNPGARIQDKILIGSISKTVMNEVPSVPISDSKTLSVSPARKLRSDPGFPHIFYDDIMQVFLFFFICPPFFGLLNHPSIRASNHKIGSAHTVISGHGSLTSPRTQPIRLVRCERRQPYAFLFYKECMLSSLSLHGKLWSIIFEL